MIVVKVSVEISASELDKLSAPRETIMEKLVAKTGVSFVEQADTVLIQGDWQSICKAKQLLEKVRVAVLTIQGTARTLPVLRRKYFTFCRWPVK